LNKTLKLRELQKELKKLEIKVALMEKESVLFPNLRKEKKLKRNKEKKFETIYQVKTENDQFSLNKLLKFYSLSSSGYYKYIKEKELRKEKDFRLFLQINQIFNKSKEKKGYRRISMDLGLNHKKVHRIMKKYGLRAKIRRINNARVSLKKNKENRFVQNILNRAFNQKTPHTFASTDITYLKHKNIFSFLSVTKDLASGEVLSYKLSKKMDLDLVLKSINDLRSYFIKNNLKLDNLILHSDQGFQYTNKKYYNKLKELGITQSMSRRGNSVDNAPIESFFGHMKDEIEYRNLNFNELKLVIDKYMLEYNQQRKQ
jgi:transposase InsO family protein